MNKEWCTASHQAQGRAWLEMYVIYRPFDKTRLLYSYMFQTKSFWDSYLLSRLNLGMKANTNPILLLLTNTRPEPWSCSQFISSVASWEQMRHVSLFPPCSCISTISLHFLLDGWTRVGEPWVSYWKAQYGVVLRPPSVPISAPALVWVRSWLQGQTKRETAAGCQGNTGATHTYRWCV